MNKDIIYIDTEDDITSVISKVKASKDKIIALVPPKRTGILQSAVNLRLLQRAAKTEDKSVVIVTHNQALTALAAAAKIPVAKNLQSKPELMKIDEIEADDEDDVIDGSKIPVGDLVEVHDYNSRSDDKAKGAKSRQDRIDEGDLKGLDIDEGENQVYSLRSPDKKDKKDKVKVPNSAKFRKRLILGLLGGVLFIVFLVWAIVFAPAATVIVSAKTEDASVNVPLTLINGATDMDEGTIQAITKTATKSVSVDITPTGTKEVGTKATGTLTLSNGDNSDDVTIPAGTRFTRNGQSFVTTSTVTLPGAGVSGGEIVAGTVDVGISASEVGSDYNLSAGAYVSPLSGITAIGTATTGGDSHTAKVITDDDVTKAKATLDTEYKESMKKELKNKFENGEITISDSYTVDYSSLTVTPKVGDEVTGSTGKLSGTASYSIVGMSKTDVENYLKKAIKKQMDQDTQQIYDNGINDVSLSGYNKSGSSTVVNLSATGQIGPKINDDKIKQMVKGMSYGDAQAAIDSIDGVSNVDVKFSFFWVNKIPEDVSKITVKFSVQK